MKTSTFLSTCINLFEPEFGPLQLLPSPSCQLSGPTRTSTGDTNLQVLLDLFIKLVELLFSSLHGDGGLVVALFPGFQVVLVQVLVGQSQRAKPIASVLLWGGAVGVIPRSVSRGKGGGVTHVEVRRGHLLQFVAGWVEPLEDDGVRSLAVEAQFALRAAN